MPQHLADILNTCERTGKLNVRGEELRAALPHISDEALYKALYRQQRAGRLAHLSRGADHWLIVPLQYAEAGSPPLEIWLDAYLRKTLDTPYYVALLSAAETWGASPYAVMVTQVMVPRPRRAITVGRHHIVFHVCARIEVMPIRWHDSADGRFKVSSPELTALDVVQRAGLLGGMGRVREVLSALWPHCTPAGLVEALDAHHSVPTAQRLGALLTLDGQSKLAARLSRWLKNQPMRLIALEGTLPPAQTRKHNINPDFKVWIPPLQVSSAGNQPVTGSAIRIDKEITPVLHVAEGLETALAVRAVVNGRAPVWSTLNKGLMQRLDIPESVQCVVIWADRDQSGGGEQAAQALSNRLREQGKQAVVMLPPFRIPEGKRSVDWNDVVAVCGLEHARHDFNVIRLMRDLEKFRVSPFGKCDAGKPSAIACHG